MALDSSNLKIHKAVNQKIMGALNGGRKSTAILRSGVKNDLFSDIDNLQRLQGSIIYEKIFMSVESLSDTAMLSSKIMVEVEPLHEINVTLIEGTPTENQGEFLQSISTTPRKEYGAGKTDVDYVSDDTWEIDVVLHDTTLFKFEANDLVRLANGDLSEYLEVESVVDISLTRQTLAFKSPLVVQHVSGATVSSCMKHQEIRGRVKSFTLTPVVNPAGNTEGIVPELVQVHSMVSEYQMYTFTMDSSVSFKCEGDTLGILGYGNIGSAYSPVNQATGLEYFTIPPEFWQGQWAKGDLVILEVVAFDIPVWVKRVSKPNCTSASLDGFTILHDGESA